MTMSKRVIVTGGTGFIGTPLCQTLADKGYEVVVLSRSPEKVPQVLNRRSIQGVAWNGKDATGWGHLADGALAIVNLAGENVGQRWSEDVKRKLRESRLNAGRAVVEAIQQATTKPQVLVQASAIGYYGPRSDDATLSEGAPPGNDFLAKLCQEWEASTAAVEQLGVRRAVARIGVVVGEGGGALERLLPFFKLGLGGPMGNGQQWWAWVHRQDVVNALIWLIETPQAHGVYNITAPTPLRNKEFSQELGRALHRPSLLPVPSFALDLILGEGSSFVLTGQRVVPTKLQQEGFTFRYPTAYEAFQAL
jgi:uncharacterized protein (TIGR01777 family)